MREGAVNVGKGSFFPFLARPNKVGYWGLSGRKPVQGLRVASLQTCVRPLLNGRLLRVPAFAHRNDERTKVPKRGASAQVSRMC